MTLTNFVETNKYKIFKTLLTCLTFAGVGMSNTILGSSLLDLQIKVGSSFETISRLVPARAIGYGLGASSCSLYEKRFDDYLVLTLSNLFAGFFLIIAPWFNIVEVIFACFIIAGFATGVFDIYCNVIILKIWGKDGVNAIQILNMCYGVGALISPIFTRPLLLPNLENDGNQPSHLINNTNNLIQITTLATHYEPKDVKVQYVFMVVGGMLFIISIPFFFCYLHERQIKASQTVHETVQKKSNVVKWKKMVAVAMAAILANFAFAAESIVGNLSTAFAVKADIKMDKKTAVLIASVFWSTFSFYRLFFIPMTLFVRESRLFIFNLVIILVGSIVLAPKAASQPIFTWISFILLGIGYSPVFSISYGSLAKYFPVTNGMTSLIFVGGVIGDSIHTIILSGFIDSKPVVFTYYLGVISLIYVIISLALPYYCEKVIGKPKSIEEM